MAQILQGGGGALKPESKNLLPENVKAGQTIQILQGNKIIQSVDGTFTSDANIVASDIKQGKIAYSKGQKITGAMPPYGPQTITPTTKDQPFGPGVYLAGQINVKGDSNLLSQNISERKTIFGVAGKFTCLGSYTTSGSWGAYRGWYINSSGNFVQIFNNSYSSPLSFTVGGTITRVYFKQIANGRGYNWNFGGVTGSSVENGALQTHDYTSGFTTRNIYQSYGDVINNVVYIMGYLD